MADEKIIARNFKSTFEQMCNFVAVSSLGEPSETIKGLVQLCFLVFPEEQYDSPGAFCSIIEALFGITIPMGQVQSALDELEDSGALSRPAGTNYALEARIEQELAGRIKEARELEAQVKSTWFDSLNTTYPELPLEKSWDALRKYLFRAFRRHGIQAAALLDPTIDTPPEYETSLSSLLDEAVREVFDEPQRLLARKALSDFLARVGADPARRRYITELADGAFNFYVLEVPPDLSDSLKKRLNALTLYLDTNFLFGILGLSYNSQVDVSHDLIRAIKAHKLPFKLRYHEATAREMQNTVMHYGSILRSNYWTRSFSRAAVASHNLSGIEQKYHELNASGAIDVGEFLRPFEHLDVLLAEKEIRIYRTNQNRLQERTDLHHEYQSFLEIHGRGDKPYDSVEHDAIVLDATRQLRTRAKSSLEAGAILISCDYFLYRFDWESSRRVRKPACVLLPNIFWQILRPFIASDNDFDKSFAETFALPEFRAIGSSGSRACSKMMQILASYKGLPEETVFQMLSNDLLIERLKTIEDDVQFAKCVELALVEENKNLMEERAALANELRNAQARVEQQSAVIAQQDVSHRDESEHLHSSLEQKQQELAEAHRTLEERERLLGETATKIEEAQKAIDAAVQGKLKADAERERAERKAFRMTAAAGTLTGLLSVGVFEACIYLGPWVWMRDHQNTVSLQLGISIALVLASVGAFVRSWRKWCWTVGILPIFTTLLRVFGGKSTP